MGKKLDVKVWPTITIVHYDWTTLYIFRRFFTEIYRSGTSLEFLLLLFSLLTTTDLLLIFGKASKFPQIETTNYRSLYVWCVACLLSFKYYLINSCFYIFLIWFRHSILCCLPVTLNVATADQVFEWLLRFLLSFPTLNMFLVSFVSARISIPCASLLQVSLLQVIYSHLAIHLQICVVQRIFQKVRNSGSLVDLIFEISCWILITGQSSFEIFKKDHLLNDVCVHCQFASLSKLYFLFYLILLLQYIFDLIDMIQ